MTAKETAEILAIIKVAYPNSFRNMADADKRAMLTLWSRQFEEYDYKTVCGAVDSIISTDTSDFMPSIGKIKEMVRKLTEPQALTEVEAWQLVSRALRNSTYGAEQEFDRLPQTVRKALGSPNILREWASMDEKSVATVIASNFMRSYTAKAKEEKENAKLPENVKLALNKLMMIGERTNEQEIID